MHNSQYFEQHFLQATGGCPSLPCLYFSAHFLTKADLSAMSRLHVWFKSVLWMLIFFFIPGICLSCCLCSIWGFGGRSAGKEGKNSLKSSYKGFELIKHPTVKERGKGRHQDISALLYKILHCLKTTCFWIGFFLRNLTSCKNRQNGLGSQDLERCLSVTFHRGEHPLGPYAQSKPLCLILL